MEDKTASPSSIWSLPLLCLGFGILAVCVLIPQAEANKKLTADRDRLKADLTHVESQLAVNQEFIADVKTDPGLAERLAQRQMREIRTGTAVLELKGVDDKQSVSPFQMINVPSSETVIPYQPLSGVLGEICRDTHRQLYAIGIALFMIACALVMGVSEKTNSGEALPE